MTQKPPFKVVLSRAEAVRKISIIRYSQDAYFDTTIRPNLGAVSLPHQIQIDNNDAWFALWDVSGFDRYCGLVGVDLREVKFLVLVFSVVDEEVTRIRQIVRENHFKEDKFGVLFFVVANKIDLPDRKVTPEQRVFHKGIQCFLY
jgi:GTPase SAR1 family protein